MATLNAIRSKDPRVYDGKTTFYSAIEEAERVAKEQAEKPLYLRDYHRENLLNGTKTDEDEQPVSYNQEQENLKRELVGAMHAAAEDSDSDEGDLLVAKKREKPVRQETIVLDVKNADKDPENFLSNFMAARAWVPTEKAVYQPFESDDEEEERRAEEYEEAYNLRFEDPAKSNERLRTHARDMAAKYSVRRDEKNPRQKKRDEERERKEREKQQRKEEKARLRKLRIEEVEEKVKKIKQAAGLKSSDIQPEDWARFVDEDWDDGQWEEEMQRRFGDQYYAEQDVASDEETTTRKKPKKPKFDDDIDINDIVPDFKADDDATFSLSDDDVTSSKKKHKKIKEEKKKESKRERRIIEQLVDDQLQLELNDNISGPSKSTGFRYRETSPVSFGLTARDILLAEDTQLNQFAGIKKLASFRDPEKKNKDQKHLGKKARLRKWRKDTFGNEEGLEQSELVPEPREAADDEADEGGVNIRTSGKKKRRRSKKQKTGEDAEAVVA